MTEKQKAQALLLYMRGYGYTEIAHKLGVAAASVRQYILRNLEVVDEDQTPVADVPLHVRRAEAQKKKEEREKRHAERVANLSKCETCGRQILTPGRGYKKRFCSKECRMKYWHSHREETKWSVIQELTCPICQKTFTVNGRVKRVYCSRACANEAQRQKRGSLLPPMKEGNTGGRYGEKTGYKDSAVAKEKRDSRNSKDW